jgi:hypothetical protein
MIRHAQVPPKARQRPRRDEAPKAGTGIGEVGTGCRGGGRLYLAVEEAAARFGIVQIESLHGSRGRDGSSTNAAADAPGEAAPAAVKPKLALTVRAALLRLLSRQWRGATRLLRAVNLRLGQGQSRNGDLIGLPRGTAVAPQLSANPRIGVGAGHLAWRDESAIPVRQSWGRVFGVGAGLRYRRGRQESDKGDGGQYDL